MALIKCPECGKEISDKAPACIHCGFPLSTLKYSELNTSEPTEHRLVIESIPSGSPKQAPAIEIICDITGISYTGAKTLVEKDVVIVKDNITLSEAKVLAERFARININFATYHNSVPRSSGVLTMEAQNEENAYIEKLLGNSKVKSNVLTDNAQNLSSSTRTETKRCTKCKAIYPADMKTCPTCGTTQGVNAEKANSNITTNGKYAMPEKPKFSKGFLIYSVIATVLFILMFNSNPPALILEIFCFVILPAIIYLSYYFKRVNDYDLAKNNPDAYQKKLADEAKAAMAQAEAERIRKQNAPKCPHCNSTNIERLTSIDRGISVVAFGLASGKIGKQYKCKNCKHMW